jgi:hypothetical protein
MGRFLGVILCVLLAIDAAAQDRNTIAGRISLPDGTPAPGASVFVAVGDRSKRLRIVAETISEWDGRYQLNGIAAGQYIIGARRNPQSAATLYPGVEDAAPPGVKDAAPPGVKDAAPPGVKDAAPPGVKDAAPPGVRDAEHQRKVAVFEGLPTEGIDIWLLPAPQRYTVSGRIYWPEGRSIENLAIEYGGPTNPRKGVWYVFDPGGIFGIDGAPPGTMVLLARADSDAGPLIGMVSTDVSVASVEDVRIVLDRPGNVEGRVVLRRPPPAGHAVSRVTLTHTLLRVSPLYPAEESAVDGEGRFRIPSARGEYEFLIDGLPAGWRVIEVRRNGRVLPAGRVSVGPGETVREIELVVGP